MKTVTWARIAQWTGGQLLQGTPSGTVSEVSTDTRTLQNGELFVALKGEHHDAHEFLVQTRQAGGLLVQDLPLETETFGGAIIHVRDTLAGLQSLARNCRRDLGIPVVGITGSSGKTSTKDLVRAVLATRFRVGATRGNLNNHIGVPLTLLSFAEDVEVGVVEMGMNHSGEIEVLAEIAAPDGGIITNVGTAHIEHLGSREAIAEEKGMLAEAVPSGGWVVLSAHDDFTESIRKRCRAEVITGGVGTGDVAARRLEIGWDGVRFELAHAGRSVEAWLPVAAEHMVRNATLAAAAGLRLGLSLEEVAHGLGAVELAGGRLQRRIVAGLRVLDDSYNANPDSMQAALRTLAALPVEGKRIAVLGRMAELGDRADEEHRSVGVAAAENGIDMLIGIGEEGARMAAGAETVSGSRMGRLVAADTAEAAVWLRQVATPQDLILLKGSRSTRMETVLAHLNEGT